MILRALLSHYRKHPVQALFLLAGIVVANVLLAGTQLINAQARASYAEGEQLLRAGPIGQLHPRDAGRDLDERAWVRLRLAGFHETAPLLRRLVRTADGQRVELLGIDLFTMPRAGGASRFGTLPGGGFAGFAFAPYQLWAAPARLAQLGWASGERIALDSGALLPPLAELPGEGLGHRLLIDIGALQALTGSAGELSAILVFDMTPERLERLKEGLPETLEFVPAASAPDPARLTRSFHLNLAAMGLLAFVVGVFLVYNALAFSYTDRRELIRRLRLAGVSRGELTAALLAELALFLAAGTLFGLWLGARLAAGLLPGVGQTLAQLYGVYITYPDELTPSGLWMPVVMILLAAGTCVLVPLREALAAPLLARRSAGWALRQAARRDLRLALLGLVLLAGSALLAGLTDTTRPALAGMACLLLGVALCLPLALRGLLRLAGRLLPARSARSAWVVADSRWLLGPAALALMAMTLALVANSGLNTMIHSFRQATDDWLRQRLAAPLYLTGGTDTAQIRAWLSSEYPRISEVERYRVAVDRTGPNGRPVRLEVRDLPDAPEFLAGIGLLRGGPEAVAAFERGEGLLISERAWRLDGWAVGDRVRLCEALGEQTVLGVYYDYGNPLSQWMLPPSTFHACWPGQAAAGRALLGPPATPWPDVTAALISDFGLQEDEVFDQAGLRQAGMRIFDRTFTVTRALNTLTLLVAAVGVFCAVTAIHHHRVGQQALLASLGLTRGERGVLLLAQWGLLGVLCMALVWPFGTALAAYLARVVTPAAFGWSFPLVPEGSHYLALAGLAAGSLGLAVLLPSLQLLRTPPAAMLREQVT